MFTCSLFHSNLCSAQNDTIKVMVYNVLNWGNLCQGPMAPSYPQLKEIVQFANADIIGLDKMECVKTSPSDVNGIQSPYFPDTILSECLNAAYPARYTWCPFTDASRCAGATSQLLFYDQSKLGYVSTTVMYYGDEDFDLFKLYYKKFMFASPDTTFLYVILCHTFSSSSSSVVRDGQDSTVMNKVRTMFGHTPNLIYMGDFNTRESDEPGYKYITQTTDTNYVLNDPPFHPDNKIAYPAIWHSGNTYQAYFTTTTRISTLPNSCGTTGGGKDWYDHILISPWLVNGTNNLTYVKNSYTTIGNDGKRGGISVNDNTTNGVNTSAPANVLNDLFTFSDKYPVMITLVANPILAVENIMSEPGSIKVNNPVGNNLIIHFASFLNRKNVTMELYDVCGRKLSESTINVDNTTISTNISLTPGIYFVHFTTGGYSTTVKIVKE